MLIDINETAEELIKFSNPKYMVSYREAVATVNQDGTVTLMDQTFNNKHGWADVDVSGWTDIAWITLGANYHGGVFVAAIKSVWISRICS